MQIFKILAVIFGALIASLIAEEDPDGDINSGYDFDYEYKFWLSTPQFPTIFWGSGIPAQQIMAYMHYHSVEYQQCDDDNSWIRGTILFQNAGHVIGWSIECNNGRVCKWNDNHQIYCGHPEAE